METLGYGYIPPEEAVQTQAETEERPQNSYNLIILDFHGTMTDHQLRLIRAIHHAGHKAMGDHFGKAVYQDALTRPSHASGEGRTNQDYLQEKLTAMVDNNCQPLYDATVVNKFLKNYRWYMQNTYIPIPGMVRVVKELVGSGVDVALLTNGSNRQVIQEQLSRWGLPQLGDDLYSSHITGSKKPDTKPIRHILTDYEKAGRQVDLRKVLMVGDYIDDIQTAHNMGLDSVLMVRGTGGQEMPVREPKPTYIISSAFDLVPIVQGTFQQQIGESVHVTSALWWKEQWGPSNNETILWDSRASA